MFLDKVIHYGNYLGDQVKGRSPKELKSLIDVPYEALLKVQALSFILNHFSSPSQVPSPSIPFRPSFGRSRKDSSPENSKSVH